MKGLYYAYMIKGGTMIIFIMEAARIFEGNAASA